MKKSLWTSLLISPAIFGVVVGAAVAAETPATPEATQPLTAESLKQGTAKTFSTTQLKQLTNLQKTRISQLAWKRLSNAEVMPVLPMANTVAQAYSADRTKLTGNTEVVSAASIVPTITETSDVFKPISQAPQGSESNDPMAQVIPVSQLSDVQPTDWAFGTLQLLVERYGCITGYPDGNYRGNRDLTRYEFATGLKSCLDRVNELIASGTSNLVRKEDLATIQQLQQQFTVELTTLRGRVEVLEARTAQLEAQQFSTTTKLNGAIIFAVAGVNGGKQAVSRNFIPSFDRTNNPNTQYRDPKGNPMFNTDGTPLTTRQANAIYGIDDGENFGKRRGDNIVFSNRLRLELNTSFTGQDNLFIRLQAGNTPEFKLATGTNYGRLSFDGNSGNQVFVEALNYSFPVGKKIQVIVVPNQELYEFLENVIGEVSPLIEDNNGSISGFGRFNPIFRLGGETVRGAAITYAYSQNIELTAVYAGTGSANTSEFGLFNDGYVALGQLTLKLTNRFTLGLTYANSYSSDLSNDSNSSFDREIGSKLATNPFPTIGTSRAIVNSYGVEFNYRFSSNFTLAGWAGFGLAKHLAPSGDKAGILNWAIEFVFPDVGKEGNLLAFVVGQPPQVIFNDFGPNNKRFPEVVGGAEPDTSYHFEALYRYEVNDYITITSGLTVITNPENNRNNNPLFIGTIRTTFNF